MQLQDNPLDFAKLVNMIFNLPSRKELHNDVPSGHPVTKPTVILGKVIDCNPCSYKAISNVA